MCMYVCVFSYVGYDLAVHVNYPQIIYMIRRVMSSSREWIWGLLEFLLVGLEVNNNNNNNNNNVPVTGSRRRKYQPFAGLFQRRRSSFHTSCFVCSVFRNTEQIISCRLSSLVKLSGFTNKFRICPEYVRTH